jgi:uncharacterized protein YjbI with pentapeptide repeats
LAGSCFLIQRQGGKITETFVANEEHLQIIRQGIEAWNERRWMQSGFLPDLGGANLNAAELNGVNLKWAELTEADLSGARLSRANLYLADLTRADLWRADLSGAHLVEANLSQANLSGAVIKEADLKKSDVTLANLSEADLHRANLFGANLSGANLSRANLSGACLMHANLSFANLVGANLRGAHLNGANLSGSILVKSDLCGTTLSQCCVYGVSAWDIEIDDQTKQQNLIITPSDQAAITVDNLKVAQFIYLLLNNQEIRDVIDTITAKAVLILGRFSEDRKPVLDAIRDELRKPEHNYLPIVFDFQPSANQATLETIKTLASMARFVIADLTDARSVLMELGAIVPAFPSVVDKEV